MHRNVFAGLLVSHIELAFIRVIVYNMLYLLSMPIIAILVDCSYNDLYIDNYHHSYSQNYLNYLLAFLKVTDIYYRI